MNRITNRTIAWVVIALSSLLLACFAWAQDTTDAAGQAITAAQADFERGVIQELYIGELAPEGYVLPSGLPGGSMGCEWSEEDQAYADAYNTHMTALLEENPPFVDGHEVVYTVSQGGDSIELRVSRERVQRTTGTEVELLSTMLRQRLQIGVLVNPNLGMQVPAMMLEGDILRTITVGPWSASWGTERQLISTELQVLLDDLAVGSE